MNSAVLTKIFIYISILSIGFIGKKLGVFKREHTKFLNTIICYITLPSAIINGFTGVEVTPVLLSGLAVGLFTNILLLILGQVFSRNASPKERVIYVFNTNCFNIGNFALPFLTGLISADGFATICMFDISVAIMCYGANIAIADARMGGDGKIDVVKVAKKIFSSPIFITYLVLVTLSLLHIQVPNLILELTKTMGNANPFLAMLTIGILFQFTLSKDKWQIVWKILSLRITTCTLIMIAVYFLLPVPSDIKTAICVVLMAPCAGGAPALTESAGADGTVAAVINSISIPISMALMTLVLTFL